MMLKLSMHGHLKEVNMPELKKGAVLKSAATAQTATVIRVSDKKVFLVFSGETNGLIPKMGTLLNDYFYDMYIKSKILFV